MAGPNLITSRQAREERAIYHAIRLLEGRLRKPGRAMNSTGDVGRFLMLNLAGYDREVFSALWLDSQNRLIAAEHLFAGTLTRTAVYPREIVRRAMQLNAACVIFAHNHPSGVPEPSEADKVLTCALIQALALVDVQVLDHFIVAGSGILSFAECGLLGVADAKGDVLPQKLRKRPRKRTDTTARA